MIVIEKSLRNLAWYFVLSFFYRFYQRFVFFEQAFRKKKQGNRFAAILRTPRVIRKEGSPRLIAVPNSIQLVIQLCVFHVADWLS